MTLESRPLFPQQLHYVIKLRRDADPRRGQLRGVIEHVSSGKVIVFETSSELSAALVEHAAHALPGSPVDPLHDAGRSR